MARIWYSPAAGRPASRSISPTSTIEPWPIMALNADRHSRRRKLRCEGGAQSAHARQPAHAEPIRWRRHAGQQPGDAAAISKMSPEERSVLGFTDDYANRIIANYRTAASIQNNLGSPRAPGSRPIWRNSLSDWALLRAESPPLCARSGYLSFLASTGFSGEPKPDPGLPIGLPFVAVRTPMPGPLTVASPSFAGDRLDSRRSSALCILNGLRPARRLRWRHAVLNLSRCPLGAASRSGRQLRRLTPRHQRLRRCFLRLHLERTPISARPPSACGDGRTAYLSVFHIHLRSIRNSSRSPTAAGHAHQAGLICNLEVEQRFSRLILEFIPVH